MIEAWILTWVRWSTNLSVFWISKSSYFFPQQLVLLAYCAASSMRLYLMSMRFSYLYSMRFFKKKKTKQPFSHTSSEGRAFFHLYGSFLLLLHFFSISLLFHRKKKNTNNSAAAAAAKSLQSCPTLCDPRRQPTRLPRPWDSPGKNSGGGCHFLLQYMKVKSESEVAQSCLTPSDLMDCSLPGSSVHGIFQARVLEWGAIAFSDKQ